MFFLPSNICNRLEKALLQPVTRTSTGKLPSTRSNAETPVQNRTAAVAKSGTTPSSLANSKQVTIGNKASAEEIKEKMEQELRLQRAEHHKKRTLEMMQQKKGNYEHSFVVLHCIASGIFPYFNYVMVFRVSKKMTQNFVHKKLFYHGTK